MRSWPAGILMKLLWLGILPALSVGPSVALSEGAMPHYQLHISAQTLNEALKELALETGLQIARLSGSDQGPVATHPVVGDFTAPQALDLLLAGTQLTYRFVNDHTVAIIRSDTVHPTPDTTPPAQPLVPDNDNNSRGTSTMNHKGFLSRLAGLFMTCGLLVAGHEACAQTEAPANSSVSSSDGTLEQIIVTAEKISVDVMHAPVSLTAINGDTLERNEIHQMTDLQFYVPGLSITNNSNSATLNIRGIGLTFYSPNISQGVPIYRDGLLVPTSAGDEPLWDLANVQVLRGPQGTLVGANSTGGAMFINTVSPVIGGDVKGYAQVSAANYHHFEVESATNLPISDTLAARIGVRYESRNSYSENLTSEGLDPAEGISTLSNRNDPGGLDMISARGTVLWRPNDKIDVTAKVEYFQNNTGYTADKPIPVGSTTVSGVTTACPAAGSYFGTNPATWSQVPGTCGFAPFAPANPYQLAYGANDTGLYEQIWRESVEGNFRPFDGGPSLRILGGGSNNITSFQAENTASTYYTGGSNAKTWEHTVTLEADILSPKDSPLQWVAGYFWWIDPSTSVYAPVNFSGGPYGVGPTNSQPTGGLYLDGESERKSSAVFGNVSYQIDSTWKVEGGLRETWNRGTNDPVACPATENTLTCYYGNANAFHFLDVNPANPYGPLVYDGNGFANLGAEKDSLFTWKLAVDYNLTEQSYLYALVATGAKAGGIRTNVPGDNFSPEKDTDYELGWKATMLDRRASIQLDGFYTKYNDMQIRGRDTVSGQGSIFNAGSAKVYGVEFAAQAMIDGWQTAATASYTRSKVSIENIINQDACNLEADCAPNNTAQCPAGVANGTAVNGHPCFNYQTGGVGIDGTFYPFLENVSSQLPNSPIFQGNISVGYRIALGGDGLTPRLDYSYQGRQYAAVYNTPLDLFPSRTDVNAKLTYDHDNWLVEAYTTNLTNRVYPVAQDNANANNAEIFNAPREYGIRFRRNW